MVGFDVGGCAAVEATQPVCKIQLMEHGATNRVGRILTRGALLEVVSSPSFLCVSCGRIRR